MQEKNLFLIIANGAAYGDENLFNALRLAIAVKEQAATTEMKIFLMSDAVVAGLINQKPVEGYNLKQMLEILLAQQVEIKLCKTCTDARGITELPLIKGISIGTLVDLAQWTLASNKVLTF
ncbi:DsrE/DsrF/TusD sulfur relay family protein [Arsenophonus apicola]|uniref:DsrE family protein n=1 Tax=Arsenophonus apicola TaxID=2879119 RepID=A0ABY8P3T6_9GAMM|nr:DsrE family protein [Arsenophonus apicola]WGO84158.1 DsrE family protein [Arsenophonus apicola]